MAAKQSVNAKFPSLGCWSRWSNPICLTCVSVLLISNCNLPEIRRKPIWMKLRRVFPFLLLWIMVELAHRLIIHCRGNWTKTAGVPLHVSAHFWVRFIICISNSESLHLFCVITWSTSSNFRLHFKGIIYWYLFAVSAKKRQHLVGNCVIPETTALGVEALDLATRTLWVPAIPRHPEDLGCIPRGIPPHRRSS